MVTYREKIRAFRREQTCDLRRMLAIFENAISHGSPAIAWEAHLYRVQILYEIKEIMYSPYPPGADDIAPEDWHPASPSADGRLLIEQWA